MKYLSDIEEWARQIWEHISGLKKMRGVDGVVVKFEKNIPVVSLEEKPNNGSGGGVEEYNGMFTCIDTSHDNSGTWVKEVVCTYGWNYVSPQPYAEPDPIPEYIPTNAGVCVVNRGIVMTPASVKFTPTSSGYIYLHQTVLGSTATIKYGDMAEDDGDAVTCLGYVVLIPAHDDEPEKISVRQVWKWEAISTYAFLTCEEMNCGL